MDKNKEGRPLKFKTVQELENKINEYFLLCEPHVASKQTVKDGEVVEVNYITEQKPYTITGLALHLGTNRQTILNYQEKEEFFDTIKRAKDKCEKYAEEYLYVGKNQTGGIFNLVNNYGWENKSRTELTGKDGNDLKIVFDQAFNKNDSTS